MSILYLFKYFLEIGIAGFKMWKYLLRRDDESPAPWEANAKKYKCIMKHRFAKQKNKRRSKLRPVKGMQIVPESVWPLNPFDHLNPLSSSKAKNFLEGIAQLRHCYKSLFFFCFKIPRQFRKG